MAGRRLWTGARAAALRMAPFLEIRALVALALASGCGWAFIELADEVEDGDTRRLDRTLLLALRSPLDPADPLGPGWLEELARDVTALGGIGVLVALTLAVAGFLRLQGRRGTMWLLLASVGGALAVSTLAKRGFDRARPDLVPHEAVVYTASFPSGHAMLAAATYLTLGVLLARVQARQVIRVYLLSLAVLLTLAIGISRVYLGVHWPTDVLAGWAAGAAWALSCGLVAIWLQRRGALRGRDSG